jgi:hypothetical protein
MSCSTAFGQISPGPLSHAHQDLDGIAHCSSCHDFGVGARRFKCLECHVEIQRRVTAGTGFHARSYRSSSNETDCARCHVEHNGGRIALVKLNTSQFDHAAETGYTLEGAHAALACARCHNAAKIPAGVRREIKVKDLNRSFLGLPHDCATCHQDPHGGELGTQCTGCHNQATWRPAPGFSHTRAQFKLTGAHTALSCEKCHTAKGGQKPVHFKGVLFSSCRSCHMDPHKGAFQEAKFAGACENCHTTGGWKTNRPGAKFAHETTPFPLRGKHADLSCSRCHVDADFHRPIAHERCMSCHEDKHKGQFATRAAGSDCASCHNETAFRPALYTRQMHDTAAFRLEGKHQSLACEKCHPVENGAVRFKSGKLRCADCHADQHNGQFAKQPYLNQCEKCHSANGFQTPSFDVARHNQTTFALAGAHATTACKNCHKPGGSTVTAAPVLNYRFPEHSCSTCHADPHASKLVCENCHTSTAAWKSVAPFDHSKTKFPLQNAHAKVECVQCHRPAGSQTSLQFAGTDTRCAGCHQDRHAGQFNAAPAQDCAECHTTTRWSAEDFSHDRTRFPLDVAHRRVRCEACHKQVIEHDAKPVRIFRGTPVQCVNCH